MNKILVYVVLDNHKDCEDCGEVFHSVHRTLEEAQESIAGFNKQDRSTFDISVELI